MARVAEFKTLKDVEYWLKRPARRREEILVFAARAALRAVPALASELATKRDRRKMRAALVLPVFRAMGAPWVAARYPTQGPELRAAATAATRAASYAAIAYDAAAAAKAGRPMGRTWRQTGHRVGSGCNRPCGSGKAHRQAVARGSSPEGRAPGAPPEQYR